MKQVVQSVRNGELRVVEVPRPSVRPTEVLVATSRSLLAVGTERALRRLASASSIEKARARPDLVRQVVERARNEGVRATLRTVQSRLDEEMPLGYSAVGVVAQVGELVGGVHVGQRVATASAGHAECQVVPGFLACPVPDDVEDADAAFGAVASVALHGLRLADLGPGSKVCVIGLGLLGQLTMRLAASAGYDASGIDLHPWAVGRAKQGGGFLLEEQGDLTTDAILDWSRGRGVDAVILTAATKSSDPVRRAPSLCRDRAQVVAVGDVRLELDRAAFYEKELTLQVARSYGPGRYEPKYEDLGVDYPIGHARWTEGRNLKAFLDLVAGGRLTVADLVTHQFPIERAHEAYQLVESSSEPYLVLQLTYAPSRQTGDVVTLRPRRKGGHGVGSLGAGNFARATLVPALTEAGFRPFVSVASVSGLSARRLAERAEFDRATSSVDDVFDDPAINVVVIATAHDTHAEFTRRALEADKHVFCERPLALKVDELLSAAQAWRDIAGHLIVGFNRRFADAVVRVQHYFGQHGNPLVVNYRVSAGPVPPGHWYNDCRQGGRLLDEVCHFVDTRNAIVNSPVRSEFATGSQKGDAVTEGDLVVCLTYSNGSIATISYASGGHLSTRKERVEGLGRGRSAIIDDFKTLTLDGNPVKLCKPGKGDTEEKGPKEPRSGWRVRRRSDRASDCVHGLHPECTRVPGDERVRRAVDVRTLRGVNATT